MAKQGSRIGPFQRFAKRPDRVRIRDRIGQTEAEEARGRQPVTNQYSQRSSHSVCIACSKETLLTVHSCIRALRLWARLLALTPTWVKLDVPVTCINAGAKRKLLS